MTTTINLIISFSTKNFGMNYKSKIPWNIPDIPKDSIIIMENEFIPFNNLENIPNIIVSKNYDDVIKKFHEYNEVFIVGGEDLYNRFINIADFIYTTHVDKKYETDDRFLPLEYFGNYEIESYQDSKYSEEEKCNYRFIKYKYRSDDKKHNEYQYLNLMENILDNAKSRPDRTGVGTKSLFGTSMVFDISSSIPILTTKHVGWKTILRELLWILSGSSDSKELERKNVTIWKDNTSLEFLKKRGLDYDIGITGPLYGHNLRSYSAPYVSGKTNYLGEGIDQMANLIENLKKDKYSRRHILTTFDPSTVHQAVLLPCHGLNLNYFVEQDDIDKNKYYLDCCVYNRSQDFLLGVPFNIGSYSMLSYIVANLTDMHPRKLTFFMGDTHIYENHIDACHIQLQRNPLPLPILKVHDIKNLKLEEITEEKFELIGYLSHPKITAPMAI